MLKILFTLVCFISSFIAVGIRTGGNLPIEGDREMYFYSSSSNAETVFLKNGEEKNFVYYFPALKGESVTTTKGSKISKILSDYNFIKICSFKVANCAGDYYYSDKIRGYKFINGKKVNLQIVKSEYGYKVGSPIIFGSY